MRLIPDKYRILLWISVALFTGFLAAGVSAYLIARDAEQENLVTQVLPLASDAVQAEIRAEVMRPVLLASMMANDNRLRDWLVQAEPDADATVRYLADMRQKHGAQAAFLAAERTRRFQGAEGPPTTLQENSPEDAWFFRARDAKAPFAVEVNTAGKTSTLFVTHRVLDEQGNFLGAAGAGFSTDRLSRTLESYRQRMGVRIHVVDAQRRLVLPGASAGRAEALDALPGLGSLARELLHGGSAPVMLQYELSGATTYVSSRFLPEPGWHVLVERDDGTGMTASYLLISSLLIGAGVTALIIVLMLLTVSRYHQRLELMAGSDPLTGLPNRQAFEIVFHQAMLEADRNGRPLSGILFDVDFIRQVNELHGHAAGDEVLRTVARIARALLRESDIFTRWNGEEFFVLLKECQVEQAVVIAEKIRQEIDQHDFSAVVADGHVTVSLGVAQHETGETASVFFARTDEALYKAKANGRNRLQVARSSAGVEAESAV